MPHPMSNEVPDQDFKNLQRLLKLKRHELPPPRFFNDFSTQITARIRSGEVAPDGESAGEKVPTWIKRFWSLLESQPGLSGLVGAAACGLLLAGMILTGQEGAAPPSFANTPAAPAIEPNHATLLGNTTANEGPVLASSTNPAAVMPPSLFSSTPSFQTLPASTDGVLRGSK